MPYYHATWRRNLNSILSYGIGGAAPSRRNFDCEPGVYLSQDIHVAVGFLIEAVTMMDAEEVDYTPAEMLEQMVVIVVDDARIREASLTLDPNVDHASYLGCYDGIIDVRGMPVLDVSTLYLTSGAIPDAASARTVEGFGL